MNITEAPPCLSRFATAGAISYCARFYRSRWNFRNVRTKRAARKRRHWLLDAASATPVASSSSVGSSRGRSSPLPVPHSGPTTIPDLITGIEQEEPEEPEEERNEQTK